MSDIKNAKKILRVKANSAVGRCRAGRRFTTEFKDIDLSELKPDELKAIENDPELTTKIVEVK